jgi:hypothetical protein
LQTTLRRYGLPEAIFVDNGSPWGDSSGQRWTRLGVWLLKLGIDVLHSRPYHPQSRGKNERFHRTLNAEVFELQRFRDLNEVQRAFDQWRTVYNLERPHQGIDLEVPASRYRSSLRAMPSHVPQVQYDEHEIVRTVSSTKSYISFKGRFWKWPAPGFADTEFRCHDGTGGATWCEDGTGGSSSSRRCGWFARAGRLRRR